MVGFCVGLFLAGLAFAVTALQQEDLPGADQLPSVQELPNPFLFQSGKPVRTKQDWKRRREELKRLVMGYEYGPLPPVAEVAAREVRAEKSAFVEATEKEVLLATGPDGRVSVRLLLTIPEGKGPFPVIVRGDLGWSRLKPEIIAAVVKRGYLLVEFDRTQIAPDSAERAGVYAAYPDYQGGRLAAWAWGYHRVIDYLVTQRSVDRKHIAITGHWRGGKAVLLAGALDERIALTAPNNSGCGGAGCYRLQADKSEDIKAILKSFPYWFHPQFGQFIGKIDRLPIDQHSVKALVAPRALLSTEALGDLWANPSGTQQSYLAAREVYAFLGAPEKIGVVFRPGGHEHNLDDFTTLLDYADQVFFGKGAAHRFDALAFPEGARPYAWRSPVASGK